MRRRERKEDAFERRVENQTNKKEREKEKEKQYRNDDDGWLVGGRFREREKKTTQIEPKHKEKLLDSEISSREKENVIAKSLRTKKKRP